MADDVRAICLQLEQANRLLGVEELRCDRGPAPGDL